MRIFQEIILETEFDSADIIKCSQKKIFEEKYQSLQTVVYGILKWLTKIKFNKLWIQNSLFLILFGC